ncbi:MAG: glycerophosphodiester phosphodiesterase [Acidimicrobiia bacterium]
MAGLDVPQGAQLHSSPVEPLRRPPIAFAHRGGRAHAPENTLEAFRRALEMGAGGLETDAWLTADGQVVLDHDGVVRRGLRRRPVAGFRRDELAHLPTLDDLYATCGTAFELSVDVKDPAAGPAVVAAARAASPGAPKRLWLCHPSPTVLAGWREQEPDVRLVNSVRAREVKEGLERRAAELASARIDAVNLHCTEWTGGLTVLFHRFERLAFAWDAQHEREIRDLVRMGIDGVHSDHVDRLVAVLGTARS